MIYEDSENPLELLIEMETEHRDMCTQKNRPSIEDYTNEEFYKITNGCGSKTFRPWMHKYFNHACRLHDFRYAIGYTERHRIWADILLFLQMGFQLVSIISYQNAWVSLRCLLMWPVYFILLLFSGWYTFSKYHFDGSKQEGYATPLLVLQRYKCRHEELNPRASLKEQRS